MDGIDAGRLIAFATDMTAAPGDSGERAEYARLTGKYLSDAAFRMLVDDILEGVGCQVTDADPRAGLVLLSRPDGPWAWPAQSGDLPWNKKTLTQGERACRMLVIPALLAYIAPSAADFDDLASDPALRPADVPVRELERFIRDFAEQREADSSGPPGEDPPVWWHWLQMQQEAPTPGQQRSSRSDTAYLVYEMLEFLHRQHLLIKVRDAPARESMYRPRRRILAHYRDLLVDDLFASLRQFASEQGTRLRPSAAVDDMAAKG